MPEPIDPIRPMDVIEVSRTSAEPFGAPETIVKHVSRLVVELCQALQQKGLRVRRKGAGLRKSLAKLCTGDGMSITMGKRAI
ncbi:hypothetical protein [Rhizobium leguminosarum]|uniref:hypothetical protein n=1 Tax=Rhizobium leguminosarum TaxID=384 RepID=UPI0021BC0C94